MPSRWVCLAILVFWAASTSWFFVREVLPKLRTGVAPPYTIDLADEVGANTISWIILHDGKSVGSGLSRVRRLEDRTFELISEFRFDELKSFPFIEPRSLRGIYRVSPEGSLLGLVSKLKIRTHPLIPEVVTLEGDVKDGMLHSRFLMDGLDPKMFQPNPVPVPGSGNVLNPMHLVNKIAGLEVGQTWKLPLFDPLAAGISGIPLGGHALTELSAHVEAGDLLWTAEMVPCHLIAYHGPNGNLHARTWVRRSDAVVLQQEAFYGAMELKLVRNSK